MKGPNVTVQYFEDGTPEEWLELLAAHKRVCQGQNITNGPGLYDVLRRHLKGTAVTKYGNVAREAGPQTVKNLKIVVKELTKYFWRKKKEEKKKGEETGEEGGYETKSGRKREEERERETGRPRAIRGQRYPLPCFE